MGIDLDGADPLYVQLAGILRERIESGVYDRRMPSGPSLHEEFDLSMPTIRKALDLLRGEGLIRSVKGRGTFVVPQEDGKS